ncbi:hypothetical protein ACG2F4_03250 [Halalkalibaculum sp. DA3122]|uniref:hypothetical protein n=1 Tax=Halalkalibaculum sp. DA3122 TaxID=3373607 RepID=UPI0037548092
MRRLVFVLVISCLASVAFAQDRLEDITAPSSPASALIGVQPQSVLSPKSYSALEAALFSNFLNSRGETVLPNDFGIEFTPYWASDHSLSIEEYLYPQNVWSGQIVRNSSFSMATTQNFRLADSTTTSGLSAGYRTTLYIGNKKDREVIDRFRQQIAKNQKVQARIGAGANQLVFQPEIQSRSDFIEAIRPVIADALEDLYMVDSTQLIEAQVNTILADSSTLPTYNSDVDGFLDAFMNMVDQNLTEADRKLNAQQVFDNFKAYIKNRQGFSLDVAYGFFLNFPANNFSSAVAPRHALWVTPSYRFKDDMSRLKLMGVFRFETYNTGYYKEYFPTSEVFEHNFDYGIAVAGDFERFSLQIEAVGRSGNALIPAGRDQQGNQLFRKAGRSDFQAIGTFVYRLNDRLALTYSLGDSFESIVNSENTLVSLLSLNFGFGGPTREDISE